MKELTKAEEQVMQIVWKTGGGFVKDFVEQFEEPRPAYNTVSTIIRILEQKGFIGHRAYGKTYEYYPLVDKKSYTRGFFKNFVNNYFDNSYKGLMSFFTQEGNLSVEEMEEVKKMLQQEINQKKNNNHE